MRLKKGMRKALSLALSTALIITSANIGSTKSKAAEATTTSAKAKSEAVLSYTATDLVLGENDKVEVGSQTGKLVSAIRGGTKDSQIYADITVKPDLEGNIKSVVEKMEEPTFDVEIENYDGGKANVMATNTASGWEGLTYSQNATFKYNTKWEEWDTAQLIFWAGDAKKIKKLSVKLYDAAASLKVTNKNETVSVDSEKEVTAEVGTYTVSGSAVVVPETEIATASGIKEASLTAKDGKISVNVKAEAVKADTDVKLTGKVAGVEFPVNVKVKAAAADSSATATATNGATTAPTSGPSTTSTAGATATSGPATTNTPAPVSTNTPAPTSDATPAPTEAPKGNMDKFNVAFNYVADDKWGEQSWGDKSVDVTGDGKYEISYTAQSDTTDIFMMILSTDLYKGSLNKDFKLVPTTVSVGKTDYKVNAKGGWCFADQEKTNAYRYNIVNPYNGPIGSDGVTYVDPAVTSIDGLGTAPVKKGDTIKVSFTVSGMKGSTSAKSKAKVTVSKKTVTVAAGKSTTVSYKALNKAGKAVKASAKTSNKKLATVKVTSSKKIKISVPKKATKGSSAKITLTSAGKKATITVKVANPVKSAKAAKKTVKIKKGKKAKITVKVTAQNKKKATTDKLTAKSSKSKIAKITGKKVSKGKVTVTVKGAKKGTSKLTIKIGKKSVKVTVKVK
jgi:hypothetical protein